MKVNRINSHVLEGAVALLRSAVPEITPEKTCCGSEKLQFHPRKCSGKALYAARSMQSAEYIHSNSSPYDKSRSRSEIVVSKHVVRIDPASVRELLNMEPKKEAEK